MESCGSLWFWENQTAVSEFGLAATRVNGTDQIMQSLMDGKLVIASVTNFPLPNNPAGHITLLRKYVDGQFYFADPFSTGWAAVDDVSRRPYSAEEVASMINVAWALSPAR